MNRTIEAHISKKEQNAEALFVRACWYTLVVSTSYRPYVENDEIIWGRDDS